MDGPVYHLEGVVKAKEAGMEDFVGPLDLILHLLTKNKMEIQDIQLSLILDQYLAWMDRRRELDLEVASEFVAMASHLVYIKTRMLLSIHDEEALSELEQLIATLQAHQRQEDYFRLRKVLPQLEEDFQRGLDYLTKTPEVLTPDRNVRYGHSGQDLYRIMVDILRRGGDKVPPINAFHGIVGREPYPVAQKAGEVLRRLLELGSAGLRALFRPARSRTEVVATFLAVLELCKNHRLRLSGDGENCTVTYVENPPPSGPENNG